MCILATVTTSLTLNKNQSRDPVLNYEDFKIFTLGPAYSLTGMTIIPTRKPKCLVVPMHNTF